MNNLRIANIYASDYIDVKVPSLRYLSPYLQIREDCLWCDLAIPRDIYLTEDQKKSFIEEYVVSECTFDVMQMIDTFSMVFLEAAIFTEYVKLVPKRKLTPSEQEQLEFVESIVLISLMELLTKLRKEAIRVNEQIYMVNLIAGNLQIIKKRKFGNIRIELTKVNDAFKVDNTGNVSKRFELMNKIGHGDKEFCTVMLDVFFGHTQIVYDVLQDLCIDFRDDLYSVHKKKINAFVRKNLPVARKRLIDKGFLLPKPNEIVVDFSSLNLSPNYSKGE